MKIKILSLVVAAALPFACKTPGGQTKVLAADDDAFVQSADLVLIGYVPARYVRPGGGAGLALSSKPPPPPPEEQETPATPPAQPETPVTQPETPVTPPVTQPETPVTPPTTPVVTPDVPATPDTATNPGTPPATSGSGPYRLARITIQAGVIKSVTEIDEETAAAAQGQPKTLVLKASDGGTYDVVYPGMMNLHNHTKQNVLPVWGEAKGQFANRFEWRDWDNYQKAVSYNMNPWIDASAATCAAFRWSELQAMVLGTTYLQGPSSCISSFAIAQVEDESAYMSDPGKDLAGVSAPTDLVIPEDMGFVWKHLKPLIEGEGLNYSQALKKVLDQYCPAFMQANAIDDVMSTKALEAFKDKAKLTAGCTSDPDKLVRYVNWQHKTIAAKIKYMANPKHSAVIVHMAEGRRLDPYNRIEFEIVKLFGLDQPHVNLVHAVGVDRSGFKRMAQKGMGLVWSPFSNFLLYGETVDLKAALEEGVLIALGSDWTPTGSRGVLDEMKLARRYLQKLEGTTPNAQRITELDEMLYKMVTENPAKMVNHFEDDPADGRRGVGTIAPDAAATFVILAKKRDEPYANFVLAESKDINLVMVDGKPVYGEIPYLQKLKPGVAYETLPAAYPGMDAIGGMTAEFPPFAATATPEQKGEAMAALAQRPEVKDAVPSTKCGFQKGFLAQSSGEAIVGTWKAASGLDLDTAAGVQKTLAIGLLTQSFNRNPNSQKGDRKYAVTVFPPMYGCDDESYTKRILGMVGELGDTESADESTTNAQQRVARRASEGHKSVPVKMAKNYDLPYETERDY